MTELGKYLNRSTARTYIENLATLLAGKVKNQCSAAVSNAALKQ